MKYTKNDTVYYQNNPAVFLTYISEDMALIKVSLSPDFENTNINGTCQGCMIGNSDNKISCTCDETQYIMDELECNTNDTEIPLIVSAKMLYDKPLPILKYEKEISELSAVRMKHIEENNELNLSNRELKQRHDTLQTAVENYQKQEENYIQFEHLFNMDLEQYCDKLSESMAQIMFAENDSRKIMGGEEIRDFVFNKRKYRIKVSAWWDKSTWHEYAVYSDEGAEAILTKAIYN